MLCLVNGVNEKLVIQECTKNCGNFAKHNLKSVYDIS